MKNEATGPRLAAPPSRGAPPCGASTATCSAAAPPSAPAAPTASTSAQLAALGGRQRLEPDAVDYPVLRRYAARLSERGAAPAHRGPQARGDPRSFYRSLVEHGEMRANPADLLPVARSSRSGCRAPSSRTRWPRCWTASRPPRRSSCATARCSSWPTRAGCAPRSSSTSTSSRSTSTPSRSGSRARAARRASCPPASPRWRAVARYLERGRPALAAPTGEPALFLSKSGRRLSTSDVRRRLRVWARHAAHQGARPSARPAALLRDPPAGGRRRPARHPGAAGSCDASRRPRSTLG